jgi:hypothetical protein
MVKFAYSYLISSLLVTCALEKKGKQVMGSSVDLKMSSNRFEAPQTSARQGSAHTPAARSERRSCLNARIRDRLRRDVASEVGESIPPETRDLKPERIFKRNRDRARRHGRDVEVL